MDKQWGASRARIARVGAGMMCVCALLAGPALAQTEKASDELHWPLPWRAGVVLEYDQQYESTNRRDGKDFTVTGTDVLELRIMRADEAGFVQRWVSTNPQIDMTGLPEEMQNWGQSALSF